MERNTKLIDEAWEAYQKNPFISIKMLARRCDTDINTLVVCFNRRTKKYDREYGHEPGIRR